MAETAPAGGRHDALSRAREAVGLVATDPSRARTIAREVLSAEPEGLAAAEAERVLGVAARDQQDMATAATHLARAVRLAEQAGAVDTAAEVRITLALPLAYLGRITAAHAELDRAAAVVPSPRPGRVELLRGAVWQFQGRLDDAVDGYARAEPLLAAAGDLTQLVALYSNRSLILSRRGALAAAEADLRHAGKLVGALGDHHAVVATGQNLGAVAARRGDVVAALTAFDEVDRYVAEHGMVDPVGLLDRSQALLTARLLVEARETAERALHELKQRDLTVYVAQTQLVLAQIALLDGRPDEAAELAAVSAGGFTRQRRPSYRAMAEVTGIKAARAAGDCTPEQLAAAGRLGRRLEAAGWSFVALDVRLVAGQIALALGRTRAARAQLGPLAARRGNDPAEVRSLVFHARALLALADGDRRRADVALRAGMAAVERHRAAMGGTELRAGASAHAVDLARLGTKLAIAERAPARVLRWAERWRAGVLGLRPVRPPADEQLAAALAELRQVAHAQHEAEGRAAQRLARQQAALERSVQRLARHSQAAQRYRPGPPSSVEVRKALGDLALVEFVESDGVLYAVVLTERRQTLHKLGATATVSRSATLLRFWLRRLVHRFGSPSALERAQRQADDEARFLDDVLLRPLAGRLADRPLVIVPTSVLHALPWLLLPSLAGRPVSVAPSAAWWHRAAHAASATGSGQVVLVSGPDLAEADAEVADLHRLYPAARCLSGPDATGAAVAAALDGADLAHVAAHGTFRYDQPLLSALLLADGPLTVYDLERLDRAPRCMVLASCDAGLSEVRPGDELMGLTAALLAQGTVALIAPLLPVQDAATRPTMLALHRALRSGAGPAAALAAAAAPAAGLDRYTAAAFACLGAG